MSRGQNVMRLCGALAFSAAIALALAPVEAKDIAGNWFTKTGEHFITISRAGPEYIGQVDPHPLQSPGSIPVTVTLGDFNGGPTHVHFIKTGVLDDEAHHTFVETYDLDLSPEGDRLIGTWSQKSPFYPDGTSPSPYELYRRE